VRVDGFRPGTVMEPQPLPVAPPCVQTGWPKAGSGPMPLIAKPAKLATGVTLAGSNFDHRILQTVIGRSHRAHGAVGFGALGDNPGAGSATMGGGEPDPSHPPGCRRAQCPSRSPRQRRQRPARHWYSIAGHDNWCGGCWTLGPRGLGVLMLKNTSEKLRLPKLNLPRRRPRNFQAAGKEFTGASAAFRPHLRRLAQCRVSNLTF
jgi:hypothetical protein